MKCDIIAIISKLLVYRVFFSPDITNLLWK